MELVMIKQKIDQLKGRTDVTRTEIQNLCKEIPKGNVLLEWCTRLGKSRGGLNCIKDEKVLIVSPTHLINDGWVKTIQDYYPHLDYKVICYASIQNELDEYDVVVMDECHKTTPRILEIVQNWKCRWIGLSGTLPYEQKLRWIKLTKTFFHWEVPLQQGIDWGIIPPPQIVCVGLTLKNDKRYLLYHKGKDKSKPNDIVQCGYHWKSIMNRKVNTLIQCSEEEWNKIVEDDIDYWKGLKENVNSKVSPIIISNQINRLGNERKKMFADLKNRYIKKAIQYFHLDDKRVIIFCNSIPQAEWIDKRFAIHSKKDSSQLLEDFNEGIISKLVSIKMLTEGVNLYSVDAALIVQASNSQIESQQQAGRTLLSEVPLIILLYFRGTRDEDYVKKFTSRFKKEYIKWTNVK